MKAHPKASLAGELKPGKFADWCQESFEITSGELYPESLRRGQNPPSAYRRMTIVLAKQRVALGGYRLAALLAATLGQ